MDIKVAINDLLDDGAHIIGEAKPGGLFPAAGGLHAGHGSGATGIAEEGLNDGEGEGSLGLLAEGIGKEAGGIAGLGGFGGDGPLGTPREAGAEGEGSGDRLGVVRGKVGLGPLVLGFGAERGVQDGGSLADGLGGNLWLIGLHAQGEIALEGELKGGSEVEVARWRVGVVGGIIRCLGIGSASGRSGEAGEEEEKAFAHQAVWRWARLAKRLSLRMRSS